MILIADSGSTKTDWAIIAAGTEPVVIQTQGINPVHQSREEIVRILSDEFQTRMSENLEVRKLKSSGRLTPEFPYAVYFYGSGVRPEKEALVAQILYEVFPQASTVEAHSDLLGAARALCGRKEGIACILGTGANSCLYDGTQIVKHTPAMGYILGDEGSGAVLGKRLIHHLYSGQLSEDLKNLFEQETKLTLPILIERVYRQPLANRFLASLSDFISRHIDEEEELQALVHDNFTDFLSININPYGRPDLPVSFVGSVAWYYQHQLREAADRVHFKVGTIFRSPLEGLIKYHQEKS